MAVIDEFEALNSVTDLLYFPSTKMDKNIYLAYLIPEFDRNWPILEVGGVI